MLHKGQLGDELDEEGGDDWLRSWQAINCSVMSNPGRLARKTASVISFIFDGLLRVPTCKYVRAQNRKPKNTKVYRVQEQERASLEMTGRPVWVRTYF